MINNKVVTRDAREIKILADRLAAMANIKKYNSNQRDEGTTLAHALSDIEHSCTVLNNHLIPLMFENSLTDEKMCEVLLEIGEELRHIVYHISDSEFYKYLVNEE